MKAQGFTLVELLAVIVILAVLALIATPVVLSIIDDAKESAMLRSAEMYLSGVENAVMRENMNSGGNFRPNECTISSEGNLDCEGKDGIIEVEVNGEKPNNGKVVFENGKIKEVTLDYQSGTIVKNEEGNLVYSDETTLTYTSLGNWEHQVSDETVEKHIDKNIDGICDLCECNEIPGLYQPDGNFISWQKLLDDGELKIIDNIYLMGGKSGCCTDPNDIGDMYGEEGYCYFELHGKLIIAEGIEKISSFSCHNGCSFDRYLDEIIMPKGIKNVDLTFFNVNCLTFSDQNIESICLEQQGWKLSSFIEIEYPGSKEKWNNIELGSSWNSSCPEITVHCTDGDVVIPASNA